jgi:hypothetical protein
MKAKRRGVALIVVLGTLAVLALLATTFATLAGVERRVTRNYLDGVRARLAAESGVEAALALLQQRILRGSLWTETSWSVADDRTIRVDGREINDAGYLGSGSYGSDGDFYRVRISDANSRINVNDGAPGGPDCSVSRNLRRILNILGALPSVKAPGLGDKFLRSRPSTGYASVFDLIVALDHDAEAFERVRPFVTVRAWSDPDVCNPVPLSSEAAGLYAVDFPRPLGDAGPIFRFGHQKNFRGEQIRAPLLFFDPQNPDPAHNRIWGRDSLNPQWIEIVRRSPVNVNTASREVLMALITDLEGFLLVERRRDLAPLGRGAASLSPCKSPGSGYSWTSLRYRYDGRDDDGAECGLLYRTVPFTGPGGRSTGGIPAETVVDEIVACRDRKRSTAIKDLDYAAVPFGGPFGSWAQFNLFVDALVERGLLADRREDYFWDSDASGRRMAGSPLQLRTASQAIGDVLKANFNPNLHLNELNPNRTLYTHVDKTDLLVHSTEFCFTPMGQFEIESEGRIVRPLGSDDHESVATRKTVAFVKLFDAVRETSQAQFYRGDFPARRAGPETNNNLGLESGPEPDNGPAPSECRFEGYLQLPTVGSTFSRDETKPKNELRTTLTDASFYPGATPSAPGGAHLGSAMHSHFQFDHAAHHHASCSGTTSPPYWNGFRLPQGAWQTAFGRRGTLSRNWEDRTESIPSPYSPVDSGRAGKGDRYRLARSFSAPAPAGFEAASSDLRIDGAYVERDSSFGYWFDENVSFNFNEGSIAFWIKPAFAPESTGKRRTLLSMGRYHAAAAPFMNPSPFGLYFVPPHGGDEPVTPSYAGGVPRFRPCSLAFGFGFSAATGYGWEMGGSAAEDKSTSHAFVFSPTLNRDGRGPLRAREWTHVAVTWDNPRDALPTTETVRIYVNGRVLPDSVGVPHLFTQEGQPFHNTPWWSLHSIQALLPGSKAPTWVKNTIRLGGEPSKLFDLPGDAGLFPANFTADATFDEFYVWTDRAAHYNGGLWGVQQLWSRGRYYRPDDRDPDDARFRSGPVDLGSALSRTPGARRRLLGVAWTELAEDYDRSGTSLRPKLLDYSVTPPAELRPAAAADMNGFSGESMADVGVELGGAAYGPFRNAAFSAVRDAKGRPVAISDAAELRYTAKLKMGVARNASPILLSTPVVDDVTLYFDAGAPKILGWVNP